MGNFNLRDPLVSVDVVKLNCAGQPSGEDSVVVSGLNEQGLSRSLGENVMLACNIFGKLKGRKR